jgi:uncharacterized protein involved in exopolysaccharide biosynthesis
MTLADQPDGEINLAELIQRVRATGALILQSRRIIVRAIFIGVGFGLGVAMTTRPEFSATTRLLPYRSALSAGGLSGLAGLAGIQLPSGAGEQTITADLYPVIARTRDFRMTVAETPLHFAQAEKPMTLVQYFETHRTTGERIAMTIADWREGVTSLFGAGMSRDSAARRGGDGQALRTYGKEYLEIVDGLDERLVVSIDKKTSVITMTGMMPDPFAAADLVQTASRSMMQRIIDYEARKAGEQLRFVEEQYGLSKTRYEEAQRALAQYEDRNRILIGAVAQVQRDRLRRDYDIAFQVYQKFSLELEQARIKKNQDTPVFAVLEQVAVPNERIKPRRAVIVVVAALLGLIWGVAEIGVRQLMSRPAAARS